MKTIYKAIMLQLSPLLHDDSLRWVDLDRGQLKKPDNTGRYLVAYPCALISIDVKKTSDISDTIQECRAAIRVTLAFDPLGYGRIAANAPEEVREQGLDPYEVIAKVYSCLQGFDTENFSPLTRMLQGEITHNDLFVYQILFNCDFEDNTAEDIN